MGLTVSWDLEKRDATGKWHLLSNAIYLSRVAMDENYPDGESKDVSMDLEIPIQSKFATDGFPADASVELSNKADELFNHSVEELLEPPFFGWILLQEVIDADWAQLPGRPLRQHSKTWQLWLNRMAHLGRPDNLRLVFTWTR